MALAKRIKFMYNDIIKKISEAEYGYYRRDERSPVFLSENEIDLVNDNINTLIETGSELSWSFRYQIGYVLLDTFYNNSAYFKNLSDQDKLSKELREFLYKEGIFFGESCHYSIAKNTDMGSEARVMAAGYISNEEYLKELSKSKNAKVRAVAYKSLGIEKNLDAISKDRSKEVRELGIDFLPFGSPDLKSF